MPDIPHLFISGGPLKETDRWTDREEEDMGARGMGRGKREDRREGGLGRTKKGGKRRERGKEKGGQERGGEGL